MIGHFSLLAARTKLARAHGDLDVIGKKLREASTKGVREQLTREINAACVQINTAMMILDEGAADQVKLSVFLVHHTFMPDVDSIWLDEAEAQKRADELCALESVKADEAEWSVSKTSVEREWRAAVDAEEVV